MHWQYAVMGRRRSVDICTVISCIFPPEHSYHIPTSLISLQFGKENLVWHAAFGDCSEIALNIDVTSSIEASLQKSTHFFLI